MHLVAVIVPIWKTSSSEFGDTIGGRDRASVEMHYRGHDRVRLDEYLEPVNGRGTKC
jgi:hypothetical protein